MTAPRQVVRRDQEQVFTGDGEMAALMRELDWASTSIGPVSSWSPSLRMMVPFMLANRFPLLLMWGKDFCQLYNDAFRPILGNKHPVALGQSARDCWSEIWDTIGPLLNTPFHGGPSTWMEDIAVEINRYGFVEETHFTAAYSPVPDESVPSGIGGVLATVHEISDKIVNERRMVVLRDLGAKSAETRTAEEACASAASILAKQPKEIPFALLYLLDRSRQRLHIAGVAGADPGSPIAPTVIGLGKDGFDLWPVADVLGNEAARTIENLADLFGDAVPVGPWSDPPQQAVVTPIRSNLANQPAGVLIAGLSSRLRVDEQYLNFVELAAGQVATAVANARAYEEERERAEALLELDRAKTVFFSNISHEFRTPLALLLGPLESILSESESRLLASERQQLDVAYRNASRLLKLVNTLLDFSRIEAGRVHASYEPIDLAAFTADLSSVFRSAAENAGLRLKVLCPPLSQPVWVDAQMWEKIVLNLLSNAFKFTFEGEIEVSLEEVNGDVELRVRDTGTGIPAAELPRVFERFHTIKGARGRSVEGTGIGLSLVQELARLHGGTVSVQSELDCGSTFTVRIPKEHDPPPGGPVQTRPPIQPMAANQAFIQEALGWGSHEHVLETALGLRERTTATARDTLPLILIADDNADMRHYLQRLLSSSYEVVTVSDGTDALHFATGRTPDLVLADVMMPRLDGFGLLRELRATPGTAEVPIILLSARAGEESRIEGLDAGADDYLIKPFSAKELLARVDVHIKLARLRRDSQEALRQSEERFRHMADNAPVMVWVTEQDASCSFLSRSWYEFTGQTPETGLRFGWLDAVHPEDRERAKNVFMAANRRCKPFRVEYRLRRKDGEYRWSIDAATPRCDSEGNFLGYIGSVIDITERKIAEDTLRDAGRRKDEFLATLAHELRNPLTPIKNCVQLLRSTSVTKDSDRICSVMERQIDHMVRLIDDLLELSRITRGAIELRKELVSVADVIEHAVESSEPLIQVARHRLEITLPQERLMVDADPVRLAQILSNLLNNAAKFTDPGGRITISATREGIDAIISVRDNGIGIPPDMLPQIFEMFTQARSSRDNQSGLGIGLSLARSLTRMHGGVISAASPGPGQGSEFTVRLPLAARSEPETVPIHQPATAAPAGAILVVDDNRDATESLGMLLQLKGHEVRMATDGATALNIIAEFKPSVVLLDIGMPGMDGYEVARRVRQSTPAAPPVLVALTGWGQEEDRRRTREAGFDHHLIKPVDFDVLERLLADIEGHQA